MTFNRINLIIPYILFPLLARKRAPYILPLGFLVLGYFVTQDYFLKILPVTDGVRGLYRVHAYAFGLGTLLGTLLAAGQNRIASQIVEWKKHFPALVKVARGCLFILAIVGLSYTLTHPKVGAGWRPEQWVSLYSSGLIILVMILKPVEIKLWNLLGAYSFFIYLIHWPLIYRYDFLFSRLPSGIAMLGYLVLFLIAGYAYTVYKARFKKPATQIS